VIDRVNIETTFRRMEKGEMDYLWTPPKPYFQEPSRVQREVTMLTHQLGFQLYEGLPFVWEESDFGTRMHSCPRDFFIITCLIFF
jgi:hypothetical protein